MNQPRRTLPPTPTDAAAIAASSGVRASRDAAVFAASHTLGRAGDEAGGLYRLLVESVRDYAIFALDTQGYVLSWNAGAERFKGYRPDEIIGQHFSVFYPEQDRWKPPHELEVATREGRFEEEGWRVRKDGTQFWANVVITALRDERGDLVGFAKVTRDLTERRNAQLRELESARRAALSDEANRTKATFLAAMSHELRTPLNAIAGYTDLLLTGIGGTVSEQHRIYLERIRGSQQHLLSIINDILNFSRIEAGQLEYRLEPVSLRAAVDAVAPMIEPQAAARKLELVWRTAADADAIGDRAKIEQILLNLLSNAVKFTNPGGRIEVRCVSSDDQSSVSVADTGIGIAAGDLPAIFEPFIQVGRSLTSPQEGTGLGLAISNDLAKGMGGTLKVESIEGTGSTFTLTLPRSSTKR